MGQVTGRVSQSKIHMIKSILSNIYDNRETTGVLITRHHTGHGTHKYQLANSEMHDTIDKTSSETKKQSGTHRNMSNQSANTQQVHTLERNPIRTQNTSIWHL